MTAASLDTKDRNLTNVVEAWSRFANLNVFSPDAQVSVRQASVEGVEALARLLQVALRDTGQSQVIARFLLGLYNGARFPFCLTDFRRLDHSLFVDCITVMQMDYMPVHEVHTYFKRGSEIWERMGTDWGFTDHRGESWR